MPTPQEIIEGLQQKAAAALRPAPWASIRRRVNLEIQSMESLAHRRGQRNNPAQAPTATRGRNAHFARIPYLLNTDAMLLSWLREGRDEDRGPLHPAVYLSMTSAGQELRDWLLEDNLLPATAIIETITVRHNNRPSPPSQDIEIRRNPIHAWSALREPIIDRLVLKRGFAGLFQKQERTLTRLGDIWNACMSEPPLSPTLVRFNSLLKSHTETIDENSAFTCFHIGHLAAVFFQYEILLRFGSSYKDKTGVGELLEKQNPTHKLFRLLQTKAVRTEM